MSGLTALVSKGPIDRYLTSDDINNSHFRTKYSRKTHFAQAPKLITDPSTQMKPRCYHQNSFGDDVLSYVWFEGPGIDQSVL